MLLDRLVLPSFRSGEIVMGHLGLLPYFRCSILLIYQTWQLWVSIDFSTSVLYCLFLKTVFEWSCKYNFSMKLGLFTLKFLMRTLSNYLSQGIPICFFFMGSICNCTEILALNLLNFHIKHGHLSVTCCRFNCAEGSPVRLTLRRA